MKKTLVLYETYYGITKEVASIFSKIVGNVKLMDIGQAPNNIEGYDNLVLAFAFHGFTTAEKIKKYLEVQKDKIENKKIVLIGVGLSKKDLNYYAKDINKSIGREADYMEFVSGELRVNKLTEEDKNILDKFLQKQNMKLMDMGKFKKEDICNIALKYRDILNNVDKAMNKEKLIKEVEEFLTQHNTCTLATAYGDFTRATPIEYIYYKNCFYFLTEGGYKFYGIIQNPNVSICVYNEYSAMNKLQGLQLQGNAEIIEIDSLEYKEIMKIKGLTYSKLPIDMNMIKVSLRKIEFINSNFKNDEFDAKQIMNL